ncbi:GNAT family N-acetyltransferase [Nonomuraea gerenzanensis]|uniref:Histone acetyltransferase HPA2 n=1 Tax=Nonomuraea gerenzanensis TaxID=93944 RepID=A0A1M4EMU4_9ACTN|nr:GNAT family N-acetyltransferase [Nonomuraea gerenzanensis]UBU11410.1 GNAT family N-acetyltransferase [Nonomuraea gerenzanensis]SBO99893.1 Histone acetyltransferase HPA2 [Nonomuraea gerenzanensis]
MKIVVDDLRGPEIAAFLEEHLEEMRAITPPGSVYALDLDALRVPEVTFWSVYDGDELVGCGAIKRMDDTHGEIKSMRTAYERRRDGIAGQLLTHMLAEAEAMGLTRLSLETGSTEHFARARKLYEKFGFEPCGPFGGYGPDPHSAFMTRTI